MRNISYNLPVTITKQGKRFVAYTPSLDLSTTGKSIKDAQNKFQEVASIFLEEILDAGTADEVLSELGWKKVQKKWNPPKIVSSLSLGVSVPV